VWASIVAIDIEARTWFEGICLLIEDTARPALTARECACADWVFSISELTTFLVAETAIILFVVLTLVMVVHMLLWFKML
jgi:hypothetical protein